MTSNLCILNVDLNENKEDVQSIFAGPCYVLSNFNICYRHKTFSLTNTKRKISRTSSFLVLKVKNYFLVTGKSERRHENKAISFSHKRKRENQRELFKFMALKWPTRRTIDKFKVTRSTNELSLPCKSLPS